MSDHFARLKTALADAYAIERELGSGGMATVYLAEDLKHHRKVAVKVLRPELAATLGPDRFLREIEVAAQLTHPHILPLHDSGDADGFLYYVMPYIDGESLRDRLSTQGELPVAEAVKILRDVVDALSSAHKHGLVHRDIKPDNILLSQNHAMVTDFGVAKAVHEATGRERLTTAGVALGTPSYMAPEQASAEPHVDHRADIYAVGALAYELLTGRPPFTGATSQMILAAHITETPTPVTDHRAAVPPVLGQLVMKCLEKKPADRWQTAEELLPQLEAIATPSGGITPTATAPVTAASRKTKVAAMTAAAAVVIVLGVTFFPRPDSAAALDPDRVIVTPFENRTGSAEFDALGEMAAQWITQGISQANIIPVVPDAVVHDALDAVRDEDAEVTGATAALRAARETHAGKLVAGTIFRVGERIQLQAEIVDVGTRDLLSTVPPQEAATGQPEEAVGLVRQRVMAELARLLDSRLADFASSTNNPTNYRAHLAFTQGVGHYQRGEYPAAIAELSRSASLDTTFMLPLLQMAPALAALGDPAASDSVLRIVDQHRDQLSRYDILQLEGYRAGLRGDPAAMLAAYRSRAEMAPSSGRDLYGHAYAASVAGRPQEALDVLLKIDPDRGWVREWPAYWWVLAVVYHRLGRFEEGLRAAEMGWTRHSDNRGAVGASMPSIVLGALAALGETSAIQAHIAQQTLFANLGVLDVEWTLIVTGLELSAHGHADAGRQVLSNQVAWLGSRASDDAATSRTRFYHAYALSALGQWDEARAVLEPLVAEFPDSVDYEGQLAVVLAGSRDKSRAAAIRAKIGELDRPYRQSENLLWDARISAALDERDRAVRSLREAYDRGLAGLVLHDGLRGHYLRPHRDPAFASMRDYPPFVEFLRPKV